MTDIAGQNLESGTLISRYEIREELGEGGFGVTYRAFDTQLHCEVAIKEYLPAEFAVRSTDHTTVVPRRPENAKLYEYGLNRFLDEARVLAKFKNRHIVRVSDFMKLNGTAYLVMDYEEGQPLGELLVQRGGSLAETEIKNIFIPILDGLKTVHDAGLLHRDIKPDNIYLRSNGPPVLLDFGAARQYTANRTTGVTAIVTPGYAPFEQYQPHGELGAWTDLYAVGATLYHCISGKPPIDVLTRHGVRVDPLPPAIEVGVDRYSDVLLQTVDWMLRQQPDQRPQSVDEVLPCIQGRAEPPVPPAAIESQSQAQNDVPTVRVTSPGNIPAATTIRRSPFGPARGDKPLAGPVANRRIGLMVGIAVAMLSSAGAIWWYVNDQNEKQLAIQGQQEGTRVVQREAERKLVEDAKRLSQLEAQRKATEEADRLAKVEAEQKLVEDAERLAQLEKERKATEEARLARVEAERKLVEDAKRLSQLEAQRKATEEADRLAKVEAEQKLVEDAKRLAQLEVERKATEKAARLAQAKAGQVSSDGTPPSLKTDSDKVQEGSDVQDTIKASADKPLDEVQSFIDRLTGGSADEVQSNKKPSTDHAEQQATTQLAKVALSQQDRATIKKLLAQAEEYLSASMFVGAGDKNAGAVYRKILEIDPNDRQANNGLIQIAAIIAKAAALSYKAGNKAAAKLQVERGLQLQPQHPELLQLQQKLKQNK